MSKQHPRMTVGIDRLFLATDNPRHEKVDNEQEAIDKLCTSEKIRELASDILQHGPSPSEIPIVYPVGENIDFSDIDETTQFIVADGNRRVCALKLLHDPERAPTEIRSSILTMAKGQDIVEEIEVVVIPEEDERRLWMSRIHDGAQDGRGRKQWGAQEKARFNSGNKPDRNTVALKLFDYAEKRGLMKPADRKGSLSHMNRLISNPLVASELGLDRPKGGEELSRNRPANEFDAVLAHILEEAKKKTLGSQAKAAAINDFA